MLLHPLPSCWLRPHTLTRHQHPEPDTRSPVLTVPDSLAPRCTHRAAQPNMSSWVAVLIAALGIFGTLAATVLAQRGEAKRASRARHDALEKERREAVRSDYREILRFISRTRIFVLEMRRRLAELEYWTQHKSSDAREVEDLEARAEMLRRSFLDELPDMQCLVGAWAPDNFVAIFDKIADSGHEVASGVNVALYFKVDGKRYPGGIDRALGQIDDILTLLNQARDLLRAEQLPSTPGSGV